MSKRVLVTGGAGFIGSHVCERLIDRGDTVACLDSFDPYYERWIKERNLADLSHSASFELFEVDIRNQVGVALVFDEFKPDVVVHLAARAGVRPSLAEPQVYYEVNIGGSQTIMDQAMLHGCSHVVMASSSSVYGGITATPFRETMEISRPLSPYAASKAAGELIGHVMHKTTGLNVTMLRFFTAYGPRQRPDMAVHRFTKLIDAGEPVPMFGDGSSRRDYTYIDDIVDGVVRSVDRPLDFEILNLGEERTTTLRDLIATIATALGKPVTIDPQPTQTGDMEVTFASVDKARDLLGYAPHTPIEEGIRRFVAWYREQNGR